MPSSNSSTEITDPSKHPKGMPKTNSARKREISAVVQNVSPAPQKQGLHRLGSGITQQVHSGREKGENSVGLKSSVNSAARSTQNESIRDETEEEIEVCLEPYKHIPDVRFLWS
jgi:hypothetical protein